MKINKTDKKQLSQDLGKVFKDKDTFFTSFSGLTFKQANALRDSLRPSKARFKVMRNTIVSHAIENASLKSGEELKGPTAVITLEDPNEITRAAKALLAFVKTTPTLKVRGGFASQKWLTASDLEKLSKIGSKTELISQLASMLYTNLAQIRFVLEAPTRDLAYAINAVKEKKEKEAK
jgi:large subunit ribosomal protein L10